MDSRFPVVNNLYSIHFTPPHTITTTQCKLHEHKWNICISGCKFNSNERHGHTRFTFDHLNNSEHSSCTQLYSHEHTHTQTHTHAHAHTHTHTHKHTHTHTNTHTHRTITSSTYYKTTPHKMSNTCNNCFNKSTIVCV